MATFSMTGFGRAEKSLGGSPGIVISVEMKSVNHRFLDVSCKLPGVYQRVEPELQKSIRSQLRRGRVDVFVSRTESGASGIPLPQLNEGIFRAAFQAHEAGFLLAGVQNEELRKLEAARHALSVRGVVETGMKEPDLGVELPLVLETAALALQGLRDMRIEEGKALETELREQLLRFEKLVDGLTASAALSPKVFQDRLNERISRLLSGAECDPQRLAQEVALLVERADVTEELTRLRSHVNQFRSTFASEEGGKKFEFLLQEMGREINTTGSKSQSAEIAQAIVESKLVLERLREQVLNVE